jgi:hypothetical protein
MLSCNFGPVYFSEKKIIEKDLTFLKIRGLLKAFFVLLKNGHLAQVVVTFTPLESPAASSGNEGNFLREGTRV